MSNQVFHYSNSGISSGQRFYLKDEVSGIFLNKLNINSDSNIVANNLVYNTGDQTISGIKSFTTGIDIINGTSPQSLRVFNITGTNTGEFALFGWRNNQLFIGTQKSNFGILRDLTLTGNNININGTGVLNIFDNTNIFGNLNLTSGSGIFSLSGSGAIPLTLPNNPLSVVGSGNSYLQLNIQNRATGTNASADLVITANNGTDTSNYINLGINNSGYNNPNFSNGSGLDGYLFINGGNLDIGTQTTGTSIEFHAGGTTANKVIARINESGLNLVSGNLTVTNNIVVSGSGTFNNLDLNNIDVLSLSGVDVSITNGNIVLTNRPTVNGTGVLLSGQSNFMLNFISNQTSTNASLSYFGNFAAAYGNNAVDRAFPVLDGCVARKILFSAQLGSTSNILFTTGYFINTTTNTTGTIPITTSPAVANTLYNYTGNINVPISIGDNVVCLLKTSGIIPTFRSVVQVYCYN